VKQVHLTIQLVDDFEEAGVLDVLECFHSARPKPDGSGAIEMLDGDGRLIATVPENTWQTLSTKPE